MSFELSDAMLARRKDHFPGIPTWKGRTQDPISPLLWKEPRAIIIFLISSLYYFTSHYHSQDHPRGWGSRTGRPRLASGDNPGGHEYGVYVVECSSLPPTTLLPLPTQTTHKQVQFPVKFSFGSSVFQIDYNGNVNSWNKKDYRAFSSLFFTLSLSSKASAFSHCSRVN